MRKVLLLIVSLMFCISAYADWSHGTAYFKGDRPSKCISVGGVIIWYNGELTCIGSSGTTQLYRGTGDICVAYPKGYTGYQFKFDTPGRVQIQYLR
ncbi:MAG: hypothetical protein IKA49_00030 [Alistipes sp.]|nr:hypothetical protein [Alistipes sp.]